MMPRHKRLPPVAQAFKDFLLSDGASMISGVSLPIDGGYSAR